MREHKTMILIIQNIRCARDLILNCPTVHDLKTSVSGFHGYNVNNNNFMVKRKKKESCN